MRVRLPSALRRLAPPMAALVVGMLLGPAVPVIADGDGVLNACVYTDRRGEFHGDLRAVGPHERCSRWETRITIPLGTPGGSQGSGDDTAALGGITGIVDECGLKPYYAYLNGHSFVVYVEASPIGGSVATGQFQMHNVPPGTYDLYIIGQHYSLIKKGVAVTAGQVTNLNTVEICLD
jgi:hypothetical protein